MLKFEPKAYQSELWEKTKNHKAYGNTFSTGAGKTYTTIVSYNNNPTKNLLIISPVNVVKQWERELNNHSTKECKVFQYKKTDTIKTINKKLLEQRGEYNTIIINYEKVNKMVGLLEVIDDSWTIILDEAHRINKWGELTRKQRRRYHEKIDEQIAENTTRAVVSLGKLAEFKYLLTATPVEGKFGGYIEYYPLIRFMGYTKMTYEEFYDAYVRFTAINFGTSPFPTKVITGYRNTAQLDNFLEKIFFGYNAKYGDYEPTEQFITLPKSKNYNSLLMENVYKDIFIRNISQKRVTLKYITGGRVVGETFELDRVVYDDNTEKVDWLEDFIKDVDGSVVVMYNYDAELYMLEKLMQKMKVEYIVINGATKDKDYEIHQKKWKVMLGQFKSASTGTDGLQHFSNNLVMYSMPESSTLYKQALGRINRHGQTKVPNYYFLEMEGTVDTQVRRMIEEKLDFTEETLNRFLLDGGEE